MQPGELPGAAPPLTPEHVKTSTFEFRAVPWGTVFEWLSDQTGLAVVSHVKPTGTFTFVPPRPGKKYAIPEIIGILNCALARQNLELIRKKRMMVIAEMDVQPEKLVFVPVEDLQECGKTEVVSTVIHLRLLKANAVALKIMKMLGPRGEVAVVAKSNNIVLLDEAGNLQRIYRVIKNLDQSKSK
jgi:type II secretory pathway component GspD/PulD (secretin)